LRDDESEGDEQIADLVRQRDEARARKDWTEADRLRDEIAPLGWDVRDIDDGYELVPRT
jgi:cysteinyl-tRNA synthetase